MSYSMDANILLYASNSGAKEHVAAIECLRARAQDPDLLCLTWPTLMAYLRIATHPSIFAAPLTLESAWENIKSLIALPRVMLISETSGFARTFQSATKALNIRGNLVPDAHVAALLQLHGVTRFYTADSDYRKFGFLEVINPFT